MAQKNMGGKKTSGNVLAVTAGVAALAAASYYFFGPKGTQHRKQLKGWSIRMKGEVVERLENLKEISEPVYQGVVDVVAAKYAKEKGTSKKEVAELAAELKRTWRSIAGSMRKVVKPTAKRKIARVVSKAKKRS